VASVARRISPAGEKSCTHRENEHICKGTREAWMGPEVEDREIRIDKPKTLARGSDSW
jgi:hypothetical protein